MLMRLTKYSEYIGARSNAFSTFFHAYYKNLIKREVTLLDLKKAQRILFIGSGADPLSALNLKAYTTAHITLCDHDKSMIESARKKLRTQHIKAVSYLHKAGMDCSFEDYDVIYIAKQVNDKNAIINKILSLAPKAKILVRYGKNDRFYKHRSPKLCYYHTNGWTKTTCLYHA